MIFNYFLFYLKSIKLTRNLTTGIQLVNNSLTKGIDMLVNCMTRSP